MPDVHLNRRVIFARDQAVRPRALSRDVQIDVISVGVDHCFGGCFVATFTFVTRFAKKNALCICFSASFLSFEGKEKRASSSKFFFRAFSQSTPDKEKKGQIWFGLENVTVARSTNTT
tara:strand:- start:6380 stop:6733 length:354 start_codon:yes stop_codon:yes gene_type:complete